MSSPKPLPSVQLDVKQIERELLLRERRRSFANPQRNVAITNQSISKTTDTCTRHNFRSIPRIKHRQHQERSNYNRPNEVKKRTDNESLHSQHEAHLDSSSPELFNSSANDLNANAGRVGRPRKRTANLDSNGRAIRGRVGQPRKTRTNTDNEVLNIPRRSFIKRSPKRMTDNKSCCSRRSKSSSYRGKSRASSQEEEEDNSSNRDSTPSRYQVTPSPRQVRYKSPRKRRGRSREESPETNGSSSSGNRSYNNWPGNEHSRHHRQSWTLVPRDDRRHDCDKCRGRKYHRHAPRTDHSRKGRSRSRGRSADKRPHSPDVKTRGKTVIKRAQSALSRQNTSRKRNKQDTNHRHSSSSSESDGHRKKRHRQRESRSPSTSEERSHKKSSKEKTFGSNFICRLM